jgi:hypothetical protein
MEENKLIMKYMGGKLVDHPELNGVKMWTGVDYLQGRLDFPNVLQFHTSWDLLRPVIVKIINQHPIKTVDECTEEEWFQITRITRMYIGIDIELAHHYVVEYIKWFNQQKQ